MHSLSSLVRAGTGNSVVLRGLSIAGQRENSNHTVSTNDPNLFFFFSPSILTETGTFGWLWIQGQPKRIHGDPEPVNAEAVEREMRSGATFMRVDLTGGHIAAARLKLMHEWN